MSAPIDRPPPSKTQASSSSAYASAPPSRKQAARRVAYYTTAIVVLGSLVQWGWTAQPIRTDPFSGTPHWWERLTTPQPHPALARIPVLPMGAAGLLSWRPASTFWLGEVKERPRPPATTAQLITPAFANGKTSNKIPSQLEQQLRTIAPNKAAPAAPGKAIASPSPTAQFAPALTALPDTLPAHSAADGLPPNEILAAACDASGKTCVRRFTSSQWEFSRDGGVTWQLSQATISDPTAPLSVIQADDTIAVITGDFNRMEPNEARVLQAGRLLTTASTGPTATTTDLGPSTTDATAKLLSPVAAARYELFASTDIFSGQSTDETIWEAFDKELRGNTKVSPNFAALLVDADRRTALTVALFGRGNLLRTSFVYPESLSTPIQRQIDFIKLPTSANLRSLYMQPDLKLGWVSSGWNDGDEESVYPAIFQTEDGGKTWERLSYRWRPAPWVFVMAIPGLMFAFFGAAASYIDLRRAKVPEEGIEGVGAADAPIGWQDRDVLDLKPVASALSRFVRNADTIPPMTIAVTGPWGTGKSSLMNLIRQDLEWRGARPVWFNAWHHQKEELILAALLENIRAQAIPSIWMFSGMLFRARLIWQRALARPVPYVAAALSLITLWVMLDRQVIEQDLQAATKGFASFFTGWSSTDSKTPDVMSTLVNGVTGFFGLQTWVAALVLLFLKLSSSLKLNPSDLMASLRRNAKESDLTAQLSFRYKFAKEFNTVGHALRSRSNPGLVIFIDDLDRCSPANLMEVLEAVNFLATAGPCFVFLGMDYEKVVDIAAKQLTAEKAPPTDADRERARQYLKKLINVMVPIPQLSPESTVNLLRADDAPAIADPPWPRLIRRALRVAPDAAVPLLALLLAVGLFASWISSKPISLPRDATQQQSAGAQPGQSLPGSSGAGPANTATAPEATQISRPAVTADMLQAYPPTFYYLIGAVAGFLLLLFYIRRATVLPDDQVEDSATFRDALRVWHKVIFAADPTPRGIKRQQNRLRLYAMRLRSDVEDRSFLDDVWRSDGGRQPTVLQVVGRILVFNRAPAAPASRAAGMAESTLVALGAIEGLYGDIPEWTLGAGPQPDTPVADTIAASLSEFTRTFPYTWPPSADDVKRFRACGSALQAESE